jgi:hypothetical protein
MPAELTVPGIWEVNALIWPQLHDAFSLLYFLSKEDPYQCTFITNSKTVAEAGTWTQDTYDKTFFYTIYSISISHNYCTENPLLQCIPVFQHLYLLL